jgi:hypothetical protein
MGKLIIGYSGFGLNERNVFIPSLLAGGNWNNSTSCGSQARNANNARSNSNSNIGGQGQRHRGGAYANSTAGHFALSSCLVNRQDTKQRDCVVSIL